MTEETKGTTGTNAENKKTHRTGLNGRTIDGKSWDMRTKLGKAGALKDAEEAAAAAAAAAAA